MKEQKFEKVVENEYIIDLTFDIFIPITTIILGYLFGFFLYKNMMTCSLIVGYLLVFALWINLLKLFVYLQGRKVYWRKSQ